ncbi:MAG: hypothetical protein ACOCZ8_03020 [Bacteroidota bacterium]
MPKPQIGVHKTSNEIVILVDNTLAMKQPKIIRIKGRRGLFWATRDSEGWFIIRRVKPSELAMLKINRSNAAQINRNSKSPVFDAIQDQGLFIEESIKPFS